MALAGRADAIEIVDGDPRTILDWKSDVAPAEPDFRIHAEQVRQYMAAVGASRGLIVYMTPGMVRTIETDEG